MRHAVDAACRFRRLLQNYYKLLELPRRIPCYYATLYRPSRSASLCSPAAAQQQVNVICPMAAEWCNMAATEFEKATGIKVGAHAQGLRRIVSRQSPPKRPIPKHRHLVRRHRRSAPAGGRAGSDHRLQVAAARSAAAVGEKAGRAIRLQDRRHLSRRAGHGLQHRAPREEESARAGLLEGSRARRVQGRPADGQSECIGHRVHDDRHAGAGIRRGRGLQDAQGLEHEHQQLFATGRRSRSRRPRVARTWSRSRSSTTWSPKRRQAFR